MTDVVVLDELVVTLASRPGRSEAERAAAVRVLRRGGFVPSLRRAVRALVREHPELRRLVVTVRR